MSVRNALIILNFSAIVVVAGIIAYRVISVRRNPDHKEPANLTVFEDDHTLETTRLEHVLRWSLICAGVLAVGLPLYWLREPTRQTEELSGFENRSRERGAVLFAQVGSDDYEAATSLACATCHGNEGVGGAAPFTLSGDLTPTGNPVQVSWTAPPLNTVLARFSQDQVTEIVTFGRAGTPMAAWGIDGGGPKGPQAVDDLVAYIDSIQLDRNGARDQIADQTAALIKSAEDNVDRAEEALAEAEADLAEAEADLDGTTVESEGSAARDAVDAAEAGVIAAELAVTNSRTWAETVGTAGEGEVLFNVNCARCHTTGWSYLNTLDSGIPLPSPTGGGAFGPSLRAGSTVEQFPGELGFEQQIEWVTSGAENHSPYGVRGISSGRMAHFGTVLSADQIDAIVNYERGL